jgi:mRNA interferase MazF
MVSSEYVRRFDVYLISLDPTVGSEIKKTRPCVVISPDEMNRNIQTVIIAPLTSTVRAYPTRVNISFQEKKGQIVLDQLRTVDKALLIKKIGSINEKTQNKVFSVLRELFAP